MMPKDVLSTRSELNVSTLPSLSPSTSPSPFLGEAATTTLQASVKNSNSSGGSIDVRVIIALIVMISFLVLLFGPWVCLFVKRLWLASKTRRNRRYVITERWLISKRARKHDFMCATRIQKLNESQSSKLGKCTTSVTTTTKAWQAESRKFQVGFDDDEIIPTILPTESYDTVETVGTNGSDERHLRRFSTTDDSSCRVNDKECPICMSPMVAGEIVSWSPNQACNHVYHHECIKEWLLHHMNCPFCRATFLLCDEKPKQKLPHRCYRDLAAIRRQRSLSSYFCEEHGLVSLEKQSNGAMKGEITDVKRNALMLSGLKKGELVMLRGSRLGQAPSDREASDESYDNYHTENNSMEPIAPTLNSALSYDVVDLQDSNHPLEEASSMAIQIHSLSRGTIELSSNEVHLKGSP